MTPTQTIFTGLERYAQQGGISVRVRDKIRIFRILCEQPGISRKAIIQSLHIRPTTVSDLVQELMDQGIVMEQDRISKNSSGRPEVPLTPVKNRFLALSCYITAFTLKVVIVNPFEEILFAAECYLPPTSSSDAFLKALGNLTAQAKKVVPETSKLLGATLHLPGFMDTSREVWIFTARWPKLRDLSFQSLRTTVGIPCFIHRMLDAALDYLLVAEPELQQQDILLIHWGYGIGAAFASKGRVLTSNIGGVCEIGHWRIEEKNPTSCTCGSTGCLETVSSLRALLPPLRERYPTLPEEEEAFSQFLWEHPDLWEQPILLQAVHQMGKTLGTLYTTFFPGRMYLYGPFGRVPKVLQSLQRITKEYIPKFARKYLDLRFLPPRFHGDRFGGPRHLFQKAYRDLLFRSSSPTDPF
ncbi:MAG: ROK family transcriptional regulator [Spirochaetales bacterium]